MRGKRSRGGCCVSDKGVASEHCWNREGEGLMGRGESAGRTGERMLRALRLT